MRTERGLFDALEDALKKSRRPQTCVELFENAEVGQYAASSNRVSDYLGHMWRKGLVTRVPATGANRSAARWAYEWIGRTEKPSTAVPVAYKPKENITVTETDNEVTIDFTGFTIVIRPKGPEPTR